MTIDYEDDHSYLEHSDRMLLQIQHLKHGIEVLAVLQQKVRGLMYKIAQISHVT